MQVTMIIHHGCCDTYQGDTPVLLSPSGVAPVCSGGQLELMCTTAGGFQEWDFHISENMTAATYGRLANNQAGLIIMPVVTESIIFNISRVSLPERLPLVSKLSIITERSIANGTEVTCTCIDAVTNAALSTTVIVMNESSVLQGMLVCLLLSWVNHNPWHVIQIMQITL